MESTKIGIYLLYIWAAMQLQVPSTGMKNFKKLTVWQNGMEIVSDLAEQLPENERFNFRS